LNEDIGHWIEEAIQVLGLKNAHELTLMFSALEPKRTIPWRDEAGNPIPPLIPNVKQAYIYIYRIGQNGKVYRERKGFCAIIGSGRTELSEAITRIGEQFIDF